MILREYFTYATRELNNHGFANGSFEARALITQSLDMSCEAFIAHSENLLSRDQIHLLNQHLDRRLKKEPLAKIVGVKEFWGLPFKVNYSTLDPRPDSETLVSAVLSRIDNKSQTLKILDLGTGSGCLALSLLSELHNACAEAVDYSLEALEVAKINASTLELKKRCTFYQSDWFHNVTGEFDIIISNPPYIALKHLQNLGDELNYDPKSALTSGETGLESYETIMSNMKNHCHQKTLGFFEIGFDQEDCVSSIITQNGFSVQSVYQDLSGHPRVIHFTL